MKTQSTIRATLASLILFCASYVSFGEQFTGDINGQYTFNTPGEDVYFGYIGGTWTSDSNHSAAFINRSDNLIGGDMYIGYSDAGEVQPLEGTFEKPIIALLNSDSNFSLHSNATINSGQAQELYNATLRVNTTNGNSLINIVNTGTINGSIVTDSYDQSSGSLNIYIENRGVVTQCIEHIGLVGDFYLSGVIANYGKVNTLAVDRFDGGTILLAKGSEVSGGVGLVQSRNSVIHVEAQKFTLTEQVIAVGEVSMYQGAFGTIDTAAGDSNTIRMDLESTSEYASISAKMMAFTGDVYLDLNFTGNDFNLGDILVLFEIEDPIVGSFSNVSDGDVFTNGELNFVLHIESNQVYLEAVAIPEPASLAAIFGAFFLVFALYRRNSKRDCKDAAH